MLYQDSHTSQTFCKISANIWFYVFTFMGYHISHKSYFGALWHKNVSFVLFLGPGMPQNSKMTRNIIFLTFADQKWDSIIFSSFILFVICGVIWGIRKIHLHEKYCNYYRTTLETFLSMALVSTYTKCVGWLFIFIILFSRGKISFPFLFLVIFLSAI